MQDSNLSLYVYRRTLNFMCTYKAGRLTHLCVGTMEDSTLSLEDSILSLYVQWRIQPFLCTYNGGLNPFFVRTM